MTLVKTIKPNGKRITGTELVNYHSMSAEEFVTRDQIKLLCFEWVLGQAGKSKEMGELGALGLAVIWWTLKINVNAF